MKTLLVVPDGVAVRNFLCTAFLDEMLARGAVTIWHALPEPCLAPYRARYGDRVSWARLPRYREGPLARLLRLAKVDAHLAWRSEADAGDVVRKFFVRPTHWRARLMRAASMALGRLAGSARGVVALHRVHAWAVRTTPGLGVFRRALRDENPSVVFCAHQRASRAVPVLVAARQLGLPTATFVYSWDNLPKGRMAVHADHFLVWSDFMAEELARYHPEVSASAIHVVGTPQFEAYFEPAVRQPREVFCREVGLDPARPAICFSGCDVTSAAHDPAYLADLARGLRTVPEASRPQVLFRRSPADMSGRYQAALEAFPEIVVCEPRWYVDADDDWRQTVGTREDMGLLVNIVAHCDAVVSVGSTMGMDFALFDKPAIFVAYDPPGARGATTIEDSYNLPHFRSVRALDPVHWARDGTSLASVTMEAMANPDARADARRAWLMQQIAHPVEGASRRCAEALAQLAR